MDQTWKAGSTASEYSKRYQPWSSVVGKWLISFWTSMIFKRSLNVNTLITFGPQTEIIKEFEKKSSAMFSPIRNTKNLDLKSETCLFRRGLERGYDLFSTMIPSDSQQILGKRHQRSGNPSPKYVEICWNSWNLFFFLRCTLDMTQHRTDWWKASNFHTSPFHRQSINFLEPMLPVMLQDFVAMFSYIGIC